MKAALRYTVLAVLFLIPFIPLYVSSDQYFPFITGKAYLFRILVEIGTGAYILLALADKKYRPRFSWTLLLYGAFALWMLIADLSAVNPHKALWSNYERMDGWVTIAHAFLFFLITGAVLSAEKLWKRWWLTMLGASVLVSVYGLWQMFGLAQIHQGGVRADASFGNAIYLAVYLMFMVGIGIWQAIESKGWLRYLLIALAAVQLVIIFATATRGVILGSFAAAGLIALLLALRAGGTVRKASVGVVIALVALAGAFFLARDTAFIRSEPTLTRVASIFDSSELKVRSTLWGMALQGAAARPITGWGQEGYNYVFNQYYHPSLYGQEQWFDRAHNEYLDWLVAGGVPALLLFVALLIAAARAIAVSAMPRTERYILLGILLAYAVQAVSAFDNLFSYILFAAILAMAHDASARTIKSIDAIAEPSSTALGAVALPVVGVVTVAALWLVNVPGMQGGAALIKAAGSQDPSSGLSYLQAAVKSGSFATQEIAEQAVTFASNVMVQPAIPAEIKQKAFSFAAERMNAELTRAPQDARLHLMYGQLLAMAGDYPDSIKEISSAVSLSPNKQTLIMQRGTAYWQSGDKKAAARDFEAAYALDTTFDIAATYAAAGKYITGDLPGGDALLMKHFGTTTVDSDPIRFALYDLKLYDRLIASMQAHVAAAPNDVQRHLQLAQAYLLVGNVAAARAELTATIAAHPEAASAAASLLQQAGL